MSTSLSYNTLPYVPKDVSAETSKKNNKFLRSLGTISFALCALFIVGATYVSKQSNYQETLMNASPSLTLSVSNEYGVRDSSPYVWEYIVEPYRDTTLVVSGGDDSSTYEWVYGDYVYTNDGSLVVSFSGTGWKQISVKEVLSDGSTGSTADFSIMSKYVRREITSLNQQDKDDFILAIHTMATVSTEDGQESYGLKYQHKDYFNMQHMYGGSDIECDHWHAGTGFTLIHIAFLLEFEQSVQAVNPRLALPYWDFVTDVETLGSDWRESVMFSSDWFGSASPSESDHVVTTGMFAYFPVTQDASTFSTMYNGWGMLRASWNQNSAPYITRSSLLYDVVDTDIPSSCDSFYECYTYDNWMDLTDCMETEAHGNLHQVIGGSWNSKWASFIAMDELDGTPWRYDATDSLLTQSKTLMKKMWRAGYLSCPDSCTDDADCSCYCSDDYLVDTTAYDVLNDVGVIRSLHGIDTDGFVVKSTKPVSYSLDGLTDDEETAVWDALYDAVCDAGSIGDLYGAASPNDIMFWVMHQSMDKLLHLIEIKNTDFDYTWEDDDSYCSGHNSDDVVGFVNLVDYNNIAYTNMDLLAIFRPSNDDLPYVYDSLSFDTCVEEGYAIE